MLRALILFSVLSAILLLADQSASLSAVYCDEKGESAGTLDGKQLHAHEDTNGNNSEILGEVSINSYRTSHGKLVERPSGQHLRIVECI